jgi:ribonuclease E
MAEDGSGFRSLVQQIQERDRVQSSQRPDRPERSLPPREEREPREAREPREQREPREPRRDLPRRTQGRTDGMNIEFRGEARDARADDTLLSRRWL